MNLEAEFMSLCEKAISEKKCSYIDGESVITQSTEVSEEKHSAAVEMFKHRFGRVPSVPSATATFSSSGGLKSALRQFQVGQRR